MSSIDPVSGSFTGIVSVGTDEARSVALWELGLAKVIGRDSDGSIALSPPVSGAAALAEGLRGLLWSLSAWGTVPVHTLRIVHGCRPLARLLTSANPAGSAREVESPETTVSRATTDTEAVLSTLGDLGEIGDVAEVSGGWWLPGTCRLVTLSDERDLLIGGPPTQWWPPEWRGSLELTGLGRLLTWGSVDRASAAMALPGETFEEWSRGSTAPVDVEARGILASAELAEAELDDRIVDAYAPAIARPRCPQGFRWQGVTGNLPPGRYMLRRATARGRSVVIGSVAAGRVTAVSEPLARPTEVRRLQYGLDALAGRPTEATIRSGGARLGRVILESALPGAELRLLTALGRLVPNSSGRYYPQVWEVATSALMTLRHRLRALGIDVREEPDSAPGGRGPGGSGE